MVSTFTFGSKGQGFESQLSEEFFFVIGEKRKDTEDRDWGHNYTN